MDERAVWRAADAHIQAVASGDVEEAVGYLFGEDVGQARANLARVAAVVTSAEVEDVSINGAEAIVQFRVETAIRAIPSCDSRPSGPITPDGSCSTRATPSS